MIFQEDQKPENKCQNSSKPILNTARKKLRISRSNDEKNQTHNTALASQGSTRSAQSHEACSISLGSTHGLENNERLRAILYKLAYKQLTNGEWKRLAHHWAFTEEQVRAIEHQYTGIFP